MDEQHKLEVIDRIIIHIEQLITFFEEFLENNDDPDAEQIAAEIVRDLDQIKCPLQSIKKPEKLRQLTSMEINVLNQIEQRVIDMWENRNNHIQIHKDKQVIAELESQLNHLIDEEDACFK